MLLQAARRPTCRFPRCLSSWTRLTRRRSWNRSRCTRPSGMPERPPPSRERSQQMPGSRRAQGQPRLRAPVQAPAGLSPGRGLLQGSAGSLPTPADPAPRSILSLHPVHDAPLACPTHDPPRPCRLYSGCTVGPGETRASRSLTRRDRTDWPVLQHRGYPLCASLPNVDLGASARALVSRLTPGTRARLTNSNSHAGHVLRRVAIACRRAAGRHGIDLSKDLRRQLHVQRCHILL